MKGQELNLPQPTKADAELTDFALEVLRTQNFWNRVDVVMKWLWKNHRDDMKSIVEEAKAKRTANFSETGASKSKDMRDLGFVPAPVKGVIDQFYDKDDDKKTVYRSFFKKYPSFMTCDKI